jgi:hypothetical protein
MSLTALPPQQRPLRSFFDDADSPLRNLTSVIMSPNDISSAMSGHQVGLVDRHIHAHLRREQPVILGLLTRAITASRN